MSLATPSTSNVIHGPWAGTPHPKAKRGAIPQPTPTPLPAQDDLYHARADLMAVVLGIPAAEGLPPTLAAMLIKFLRGVEFTLTDTLQVATERKTQ